MKCWTMMSLTFSLMATTSLAYAQAPDLATTPVLAPAPPVPPVPGVAPVPPAPPAPGVEPRPPAPPVPPPAPPPGRDLIAGHLIPPELIMQHQRTIGLSPSQAQSIQEQIERFHQASTSLQWRIAEARERLVEALEKIPIPAEGAAGHAEDLLSLESQMKQLHLQMLIRIRNVLSPEQITVLKKRRWGR